MADGHRLVAAAAMNDIEVDEFGDGEMTAGDTVDDDGAVGGDFTDCADGSADDFLVDVAVESPFAFVRWFVNKVKTEVVV